MSKMVRLRYDIIHNRHLDFGTEVKNVIKDWVFYLNCQNWKWYMEIFNENILYKHPPITLVEYN